jgi:hypothetical protein
MLPPRVNNNVGIVPIRGNTINPTIITQLRRAALDEQELQIIPVTITVNATAPAWSLQQGVILYNGHYYIPATSPLLQELPESVGTPTPQFLAVSFNTAASKPATQAFPSSVLLIEDWPQQHGHGHPLISLADYDTGELIFGTPEITSRHPR